jgi:AraC family transcriptional regulator, arabinose operon regulatory protein
MAKTRPTIAMQSLLQPSRVSDLAVVRAGYLPAKRDWIDHHFDVWALGLVVSGRGTYRVEGGPVEPIEPGSVFAVFPGPAFHYGPEPGTAWEEYFVCFAGERVRRWKQAGWFFDSGAVHALASVAQALELFRELLGVLGRGGPGDAERATAITERLLLEMHYARADRRRASSADPSIDAVLHHCRSHAAEAIDFRALSRANAMSYSHLRQRIRRITGLSPARYVTRLRCEQARALLTETDLPVKLIAARVGIADPFTFSRTFRRTVGVSPERYRKQTAAWAQGMATAVSAKPLR